MKKKKIGMIILVCVGVIAAASLILYLSLPDLDNDYLEQTAEKAMERYGIPAVELSIGDSDSVLYSYYGGVRTVGGEDKITPQDYFHIGSCSKSVLAIMAAHCVEQGLIQWDTRFFDVFPELAEGADESYLNITLDDLLSCRAGIKPYTSGYEEYPDLTGSTNEKFDFIRYLLALPPAAEKSGDGFEHLYSNASYSLASAMLEKVSGKSYEDLIEEIVVNELGLDINYGWPYEAGADQPLGHFRGEDGKLIPFGPDIEYFLNPLIAPAGDLSMDQESYAKLAMLHLQGLREGNMLSIKSWEHIDRSYDGFSLGAYNDKMLGMRYILLDGTAGTFFARAVILPESDMFYTILMNSGDEKAVSYITMRLAKVINKWWWMFWV